MLSEVIGRMGDARRFPVNLGSLVVFKTWIVDERFEFDAGFGQGNFLSVTPLLGQPKRLGTINTLEV